MKIKKAILLFVLLATLNTQPALAKKITTIGAPSCGKWVKERNQEGWRKTNYETWVLGYVSGLAIASEKDRLEKAEVESLFLWLDNYCKINPLKKINEGAVDLFLELEE